jgi:ribonucleoside-diphosphate reductase alpha chain
MASIRDTLWEGVALRRTRAAADPDSPLRAVALPLCWDGEAGAAAALALLVPGAGPVSLPRAAEAWIERLAVRGMETGTLDGESAADLADALRALLLSRRGCPGAETWRGDPARSEPRFVLNLPAFLEAEGGFDAGGYAEACAVAIRALHCLCGGRARRLHLGFADLAGLLARLGLAYESPDARAVASAIAALTRGAAEAESGRMAERLGALEPAALAWPAPPAGTSVPGLAEAARAALDSAAASPGLRHAALVALAPPDAAEALLGAATGGIAPAADSPVPEAARGAMRDAVAPFLHAPLPLPICPPEEARPAMPRQAAPSSVRRHTGAVLHVSVGGHKVALRTAEDAEGRLVEIAFSLSKEGAAYRSLMESFAQSVSLGLRQGVPLADYVDAFAYTRFGPAGAVEGDPAIPRATSVLDWAFRRLALDYLGRRDLPQPSEEDVMPDSLGTAAQQAPLLPMDLPRVPATTVAAASPRGRRRSLRLVG